MILDVEGYACPYDHASVAGPPGGPLNCPACGRSFAVAGGIVDFLDQPLSEEAEEHRRERDAWIAPADRDYGSPYRDRTEAPWVVRALAAQPGESILDLACGKGRIGLRVLARTPGVRLAGVDFSGTALEGFARREPAGAALRLARADAARLPITDDSFDAAVVSMLLVNVDDTTAAAILDELARVLRPGGRVVATVLNYGQAARRSGYFPDSHVYGRFYDQAELASLIGRRFTVVAPPVPLAGAVPKLTGALLRLGTSGAAPMARLDPWLGRLPGAYERARTLGIIGHKPDKTGSPGASPETLDRSS